MKQINSEEFEKKSQNENLVYQTYIRYIDIYDRFKIYFILLGKKFFIVA